MQRQVNHRTIIRTSSLSLSACWLVWCLLYALFVRVATKRNGRNFQLVKYFEVATLRCFVNTCVWMLLNTVVEYYCSNLLIFYWTFHPMGLNGMQMVAVQYNPPPPWICICINFTIEKISSANIFLKIFL